MLVIQRKISGTFSITIPPGTQPREVAVTVVRIGTNVVRLGIEADRDISIARDDAIRTEPRA